MRFTKLVLAATMAALPASGLQAQYFSVATPPNMDSKPFWDVKSNDDGKGCNIGYVLTGALSGCTDNKILPTYTAPYNAAFKDASGTDTWFLHKNGDPNVSWGFGFVAGVGSTITYFGGIAGASPLKELAIRDLNTNTIVHTFKQLDATTHNYTLTGNLFFDIGISLFTGGTSFSWSTKVPNQFAAFGNGSFGAGSANCGTSGCWVGAEDVGTARGDYDYNDGILRITGARVVPEPSAVLLVAGGLMGLAGAAVRRRNQA